MALISILVAAAAAWVFGAVWYTLIGQRWIEASGIDEAKVDRGNLAPYVVSFLCNVLVAAMTRHVLLSAGIVHLGGGARRRPRARALRRRALARHEHHVHPAPPRP